MSRDLHLVQLDKRRPALLLTREVALPFYNGITVAPVTSTSRGLAVEVPVGRRNGLNHDSVINCDDITTLDASDIGPYVGALDSDQEFALTAAIIAAFGLWVPPPARPGPASR